MHFDCLIYLYVLPVCCTRSLSHKCRCQRSCITFRNGQHKMANHLILSFLHPLYIVCTSELSWLCLLLKVPIMYQRSPLHNRTIKSVKNTFARRFRITQSNFSHWLTLNGHYESLCDLTNGLLLSPQTAIVNEGTCSPKFLWTDSSLAWLASHH